LAEKGLTFIRKKTTSGSRLYFVANLGNTFQSGWIRIGKGEIMSRNTPLRGESMMSIRTVAGRDEVYLNLPPGESCFLEGAADGSDLPFTSKPLKELEINGTWEVTFLQGKPSLPTPAKLTTLKSWTTLPDSAEYFSGKAHYRITFDLKGPLKQYEGAGISLGDVREIASVKLNGKNLGATWHIPFQVYAGESLKLKGNILEIEVTNLSANYMRLRDQQKPDWKKFYDINIVDITYKKFDATRWTPMPSGLLGPVKLLY
jgi:hypothetical protein